MKKLFLDILGDVGFLYKNFFHFNLSKILIFLTTFLYIFILFIPLLLVFGVVFYFLGMFDGSFNPYLFLGNPYYIGFGLLFIIFAFFLYVIGYSYSQVLLANLNISYTKREKLPFSKNYFFNKKLFFTFFKVSFLLICLFLLPVIFWVLGFVILIFISGGVENSLSIVNGGIANFLSLTLLVITVISIIIFLYLSYKTIFTYIILTTKYRKTGEIKRASYYIKKSFKFTKGIKRFFKLFSVLLVLFIVSYPIYYFENYFATKAQEIRVFINLDTVFKAGGDLGDKTLDYEALKLDYGNQDLLNLSYDMNKYAKISTLFYILEFLLIWGLFNMILVSFYKSEKNN